jgi:uncharacterized protein (DUF1330 family)
MAAYVLVNVDTSDPQKYEHYKAMAQETVAQYGGHYLVRGGKMEVLEGAWQPTRLVVLKFDSYEDALKWFHSEEYAPAKALRQSLSKTDVVLVDGYDESKHLSR